MYTFQVHGKEQTGMNSLKCMRSWQTRMTSLKCMRSCVRTAGILRTTARICSSRTECLDLTTPVYRVAFCQGNKLPILPHKYHHSNYKSKGGGFIRY